MIATMSRFIVFILFLQLLSLSVSQSTPRLRGTLIDCGATVSSVVEGRKWNPDYYYISTGTPKNLTIPVSVPALATVRSFPFEGNLHRKFCYVVPVVRLAKYMVRTTYFYGGINGVESPPVFDQIVDGTVWSVVNTTEDYAKNMSSYYEGVFEAQGKTMSICIGVNSYTDSDPFISALELVILGNSLYNSTDFGGFGLRLVARHAFGHSGSIIRYPDDHFDRFWEPYEVNGTSTPHNRTLSVSDFWNVPPSRIFNTELKAGQSESLNLTWPPTPLVNSTYYIALYFANDLDSAEGGSRVFDISLNGVTYYKKLNLTPAGSVVFASRWPLHGLTTITLTPAPSSQAGPLINGGEVFELLGLGGRTHTRDVIALEAMRKQLRNSPLDWNGDPCLPRLYTWTGVTCSEGPKIRVTSLNLTSMSLLGSLSPRIARLSALSDLWLGNNSLSGSIPDLGPLKSLKTLHLEDNQISGEIPSSLGNLPYLRELFLQNNNLTGQIPRNLTVKRGLDIRTFGNSILAPPPS